MAIKTPGSCGRALPCSFYKVVDTETGCILGPNQPGELLIKSPFLMNGYYNMDNSGCFDEEGFLKTGDVVYYDENKLVFIYSSMIKNH